MAPASSAPHFLEAVEAAPARKQKSYTPEVPEATAWRTAPQPCENAGATIRIKLSRNQLRQIGIGITDGLEPLA